MLMVVDPSSEAHRWRAVAIALGLLVLVAALSVCQGVEQARPLPAGGAATPAARGHTRTASAGPTPLVPAGPTSP